jgi:hypothetical protein
VYRKLVKIIAPLPSPMGLRHSARWKTPLPKRNAAEVVAKRRKNPDEGGI